MKARGKTIPLSVTLSIQPAISETQNTLEGIVNRLNEAEDQISELEDKYLKNYSINKAKKILKSRKMV